MLDIMRRKKRLKAILWLVIISLGLGMVLLFIPGANVGTATFDTSAATVAGESVPMKEFLDAYRRVLQNYSAGGRNRVDPEILKALGLDRQALDALINIRVVGYAAKRLGLDVSAQEIRDAVENNPNLMENGQFIGVERYKALLAANNITVTQFEDNMRTALLSRKIRNVVSDSLAISENEMRADFTRTNQEAQITFAILKKDDFRKRVNPTETEIRAYFDAHKATYNLREQRRSQYLLFSLSAAAANIQVTDQEIRDEWNRQPRPETVTASHILFEVKDTAKEAEIKAKSEDVLKRAKAGEDFAALAKKYSEDPGSAKNGGELGSFPREQMVKEFSDVAFSLKPGEISDLVRTQFGFHIIKVGRHDKPELESSRREIEQSVKLNKASDLLKKKVAEAEKMSATQKDLGAIAKAIDVPTEVRETPLLSKDSDPYTSGVSASFLSELFSLKEVNAVGKSVDMTLGYAIPKLLQVELPKPADFNLSRANVQKDLIESKASELMMAEAKRLADEAGQAGDLEKTAQKQKITVKTSGSFKRDAAPDPEIGTVPQVATAAFDQPVGKVVPPIDLENGSKALVMQVKSRTPFDEAGYAKQKAEIRERLLGSRQDAYFQEYIRRVMDDLQKEGQIRVNAKAMEQAASQSGTY
jgi:peptidyl-prolyl cis-trans isomerase D